MATEREASAAERCVRLGYCPGSVWHAETTGEPGAGTRLIEVSPTERIALLDITVHDADVSDTADCVMAAAAEEHLQLPTAALVRLPDPLAERLLDDARDRKADMPGRPECGPADRDGGCTMSPLQRQPSDAALLENLNRPEFLKSLRQHGVRYIVFFSRATGFDRSVDAHFDYGEIDVHNSSHTDFSDVGIPVLGISKESVETARLRGMIWDSQRPTSMSHELSILSTSKTSAAFLILPLPLPLFYWTQGNPDTAACKALAAALADRLAVADRTH
jgi:hypothetical protein